MEELMGSQIITESRLLELLPLHQRWAQTAGLESQPDGVQLAFMNATLTNLTLSDLDFSAGEIVQCQVMGSTFNRCKFAYATLIGTVFKDCAFIECVLVKADMRSANCAGVNFAGSDLTRVDLIDANLREANLTNCLLNWAWLIDTDLRNAILENTQFEGARMGNTKMYNTRKFHLGSLERAVIEDIDPSADANGAKQSGVEALQFLRAT
jgi:uncharacterized protein YjbI with pentapeptide repeats